MQSVAAALPRVLGDLDGPVLSDVCFEGSAILRAGGSTHPLLQATPDMGRTRWILILCAWTIVGLLFAVHRIVLVKVQGIHVSWVFVGTIELVYWYVSTPVKLIDRTLIANGGRRRSTPGSVMRKTDRTSPRLRKYSVTDARGAIMSDVIVWIAI